MRHEREIKRRKIYGSKKNQSGVDSVKKEEEKSVSNTQKTKMPNCTSQDSITRSQCRQEEGKSLLPGERFITFTFTQTQPQACHSTPTDTHANGDDFLTHTIYFLPSITCEDASQHDKNTSLHPLISLLTFTLGRISIGHKL